MIREVIVTGGREYDNADKMMSVFDFLAPTHIIQGGANGADLLARNYASLMGIECTTVNADWDKHGKAAGPIRNGQMLERFPDATIVAFPGGTGTGNCIAQAKAQKRLIFMVVDDYYG